jgi:soluble lytic murein transglycosylase
MKLAELRNLIIGLIVVFIVIILSAIAAVNYLSYRFYPLQFESEINDNAKEFKLEPSQVSAIIYEESKFDPDVVSDKDAIGLMQILPDTANVLAKKIGIDNLWRDDLFVPSINIKFGSYYFRELLDRYNGDVDLALAAYNAGFGAVDKANKDINNLPRETRDFIRKTNKTQRVYITLYPNQLKVSKEQLKEKRLSFFELASAVFNKIPNKNRK